MPSASKVCIWRAFGAAGVPDEALLAKYEFLLKVRGEINRGLEEARKGKIIATAQEARVSLGSRMGNCSIN